MNTVTIIAIVLASVFFAGLLAALILGASHRRKLVRAYEDAEDELQAKILSLTEEKASLESMLTAREAFEAQMQASRKQPFKHSRSSMQRIWRV